MMQIREKLFTVSKGNHLLRQLQPRTTATWTNAT